MKSDRLFAGWSFILLFTGISAHAVMQPVAIKTRHAPPAHTNETCVVSLVAGQHQPVGDVRVRVEGGSNLVVQFFITDGYSRLRATHLYLGKEPPSKSAPGSFPFKHEKLNAGSDVFTIPFSALKLTSATCVYVAAHAEVDVPYRFKPPDLKAFHAALPDMATIMVSYPGGGDSYLDATVTDGDALNGVYDDWCVDMDHEIGPFTEYPVEVLSSLEPLPPGVLDYPGNIDLVNYVLNREFTGKESAGAGTFTWGDVQQALWTLIEDTVPGEGEAGSDPWDQRRVDEIVADAYAHGEGYIPGCNDLVGVLLNPVDELNNTIAQVTIIEVPLNCRPVLKRETAWGMGTHSFKSGWGTYFRCCPGE